MTSITPSKGFSVEILTEVWLYHGRPRWIEVSLLWKTKYLNDYITIVKYVASKIATVKDKLV